MDTSLHTRSNYDKFPATETEGRIWRGWEEIGAEISRRTDIGRPLVVFDTYHAYTTRSSPERSPACGPTPN